MNGMSTIAWRKYEAAIDRLRKIVGALEGDKAADAFGKIGVAAPDGRGDGVMIIAREIDALFRDDLATYAERVIAKAQGDVCVAAAELRSAIDSDLESKFMRGKNGG